MTETLVEPTTRAQAFFKSKRYDRALFMRASVDSGGIRSIIAERLGVEHSTVRAWERKYPEVAEKLSEEREKILDIAEDGLFERLKNRDPWAIGFVLKTIGKQRGYVEKQEVIHSQSQPVQLVFSDAEPVKLENK